MLYFLKIADGDAPRPPSVVVLPSTLRVVVLLDIALPMVVAVVEVVGVVVSGGGGCCGAV